MMHDFRPHRVVLLLALIVCGSGCHGTDQAEREAMMMRSHAARLVGGWNLTLVLEHPPTPLYDDRAPAHPVTGTIAFIENRTSDAQFDRFGSVTHKGVYDLDLAAFRLPAVTDARSQSAVARTVPLRGVHSPESADSVIIALVPGDARLWVRLSGLLSGDTIAGSWTAEFLRTEASGRFVMTRRREAP